MPEKQYSSKFKCPHCQRVIDKPENYLLFAGARGVGMVSSLYDTCPYCHGQIVRMDIINGEYDHWEPAMKLWPVFLRLGIVVAVLVLAAKFC